MKKLLILVILLTPVVASATTIRYSSLRLIVAPQLLTSQIFSTYLPDFLISKTILDTSVSSVGSQSTTGDIIYDVHTSAGVVTTCKVNAPSGSVYSSVHPTIGTIDQSGNTTYVSNGTVQFTAVNNSVTKAINCAFANSQSSSQTFSGYYALNSLASSTMWKTENLISGLSPTSDKIDIFSALNDTTFTYTRNATVFTGAIDLTAIPAANSINGCRGILVAADILISAGHCGTPDGTTYYFVTNGNVTVTRTQLSHANVGPFLFGHQEILVTRLSSDLPGTITPAKVFVQNVSPTKISQAAMEYGFVPGIYANRNRNLHIGSLRFAGTGDSIIQFTVPQVSSTTHPFYNWYDPIVGGDSGNAVFTIVNGEVVAIGTWSLLGGKGYPISYYYDSINTAITGLGGSHALTPVDVTGFITL
jgi:hypothetical protein